MEVGTLMEMEIHMEVAIQMEVAIHTEVAILSGVETGKIETKHQVHTLEQNLESNREQRRDTHLSKEPNKCSSKVVMI